MQNLSPDMAAIRHQELFEVHSIDLQMIQDNDLEESRYHLQVGGQSASCMWPDPMHPDADDESVDASPAC